ncbi:hypothetical protein R6Q59_013931 [Mikania micrantha]
MNKMSSKGKRGKSKCKKKFLYSGQFKIEFDKNGLAKGENKSFFMSWVGLQFRKKTPYHKVVKDIDPKLYDDIWEYTKEKWNIPNDQAKCVTLKKGKSFMRSFRHELVELYVKKDKTPFEDYEFLAKQHWDSFVANASKPEFKYSKEKEMMIDGSYYEFGKDVVTEVVGKGRHHGGRTRLVSNVIGATHGLFSRKKMKSEKDHRSQEDIEVVQQNHYHVDVVSEASLEIKVDFVNENCSKFPVLPHTRTDEVNEMADIQDSLPQSVALNQQTPQHSGDYRPIMLSAQLPIQATYAEDVLDNQTNHIEDVARPQTTHTEKIAPLLTLAKSRPQKIYRLAEKLAHVYAQTSTINVTSPNGMYMVDYHENVDVESMMQLCANSWVDVGVLHLYTMYLYAFGGFKGFHKTTYFNPQVVELGVCNTDPIFIINYIKAVKEHHKDNQYFTAPYLSGSHWSLIMIHCNPKDNKFYGSIIDSNNKGKSAHCYVIVDILQKAIGKSISWHMVKELKDVGFGTCRI